MGTFPAPFSRPRADFDRLVAFRPPPAAPGSRPARPHAAWVLHLDRPPRAPGRRGTPAELDMDRALLNPAAVFRTPDDVLHDPRLIHARKREILERWLWDARLIEVAAEEGMGEGEPSRLDEIKRALLALDCGPDAPPAAAAFAVALGTADAIRLAA